MPSIFYNEELIKTWIGLMVAGVLMLLLTKMFDFSDTYMKRTGAGMFVFGAFFFVVTWLNTTPDLFEKLSNNLGLTLVGLVIASISVISLLKK